MKKIFLLIAVCFFAIVHANAQGVYNPFTQNIHFIPEPTAFGFECGSTPNVQFVAGMTTAADATQWQTNPLTITVCIQGFTFNGPAASIVTGSYASNFNWAFAPGNPNCIVGTQNQTLPGTGTNPIFPNPSASGNINIALAVPVNSPVGTILSVDVTMQVPTYMATYNSPNDDNESTTTQTFCNCYALTDPGSVGSNQAFCASGDPAAFTQLTAPSGGSGGVIQYQWQQLIGGVWTDISGATASTYDAPVLTATTQYRRNAKRSLCGTWLSTAPITITINPLPTANAGSNVTTTCTTPSATIGTTAVSGNTYTWTPATGLSATNIAQPSANPASTTTYTVNVVGSNGCTASSSVTVTVNKTPPTADAGIDKNLNCTTTSTTIGTAAVSGNTYSWSPSTGLSATNIAQPTASPTINTTYTVTVTGANGCTATDVVVVNVSTTPPVADGGPNRTLTCTTTSATIGIAAVSGNTYSWSPAAGLSATNIAQPTASPSTNTIYTVTVTGANGCTATDVVSVSLNVTPPVADAGLDKNLTCTVTSTSIGSAALSGYTYSWSPATGLSATNVAQPTANPSATTNYTVTVTGTNGCTATDVVTVNVNTAAPVANAGPNVTTTCTTPSATIGTTLVSGNTYSWSPSAGLSATNVAQPTANPVSNTVYTVTVTGANGCTATSTVSVTINKTPPSADAGTDKDLTCTATSATIGTTAVSGNAYSWSPSTNLSATNIAQPIASPTATTTYTVTVTGSNGCTSTDVVIVNVNTTPPVANAGADKTLNCTTTSSTIGTTPISGYTYSWSPSTGLNSTTLAQPTANPSTTTTYTVTVTGTNGCTATDVVIVNVNTTPPTANAGSNVTITCTNPSAIIGTQAVSGNTYAWGPSTGLSATNVAQPTATPTNTTTYTVIVTGTNGCTATSSVIVTVDKNLPVADAGADKNLNCTTTSATIGTTAISGNIYSWSPSLGLSNTSLAQPIANPSATTTYTVTVTGANGCTATDVVTVNVNTTPPTANAGSNVTTTCSSTSATIGTTSVSGNTYSWAPSTALSATNIAQPVASPSATTIYTLTVTGSNGCTASSTVTVTVNDNIPVANAGTDKTLNCATTATTIGTAAVSGNSYSWSPATGLNATNIAQPIASPTTTTTYTVTVTGANGCTNTDAVLVTVNTTPPTVDAGVNKNLDCNTTTTTIGTTGISGNTYVWSPSAGLNATNVAQPTANPSVTTTYTVTATGANGCTATDVVTVNVNTIPPTADAGTDKTVCSTNSAVIGTTAIAGNTYSWSPATGLSATNIAQPTASVTSNTTYTVTVTGANGCTTTDVVIVNFREGSVGNYVWNDLNADGLNNEGASEGINGVTVELWSLGTDNTQGTSDDVLEGSTTTANNTTGNPGYYNFKICNSGSYYVKFPTSTSATNTLTQQTTAPATDSNSDANTSTGFSPVFTINVNGSGTAKDNPTIDAGYYPYMSLGNLVWNDIDKDGIKDASESGLPGATVYLYNDANNDGTPDGAAIANTTTNSTGLYIFNSLKPGNYIVGVVPPAPASGNAFQSTPINEANPNSNGDNNDNGTTTTAGQTYSGTVTLSAGSEPIGETPNNGTATDANSNLTLDFGFYQPINLSGNVFVDNNGNTNIDGTPTPSAGTTQLYANLVDPNGNVIGTTPITSGGSFQFDDVQPNTTYTVVLSIVPGTIGSAPPATTLPTGWSNVGEDCCDNTGNDGSGNGIVSVTVGTSSTTNANFGITQPLSLGNLVWNDIDKDGIKDASESGISGATVNLYKDDNNDGTPDGPALANTLTNSSGLYIFNGLTPGNYIVGVIPPTPSSGSPYSSSPINEANPNSNVDNNDNGISTSAGQTYSGTIALAAGTEPTGETPNNGTAPDANSNLTLDFGFYQAIDISGNVYVDNNGPANVDGTGIGSPSATQVYANLVNATGNVVAVVSVNSNGTFLFTDVQPNSNYTVVLSTTQGVVGSPAPTASLPAGWTNVSEDCCDNTGNDGNTNGVLSVVVVNSHVNNVNFGITEPLSLGNLVWDDFDKDGIKDANETGMPNVSVNLYADANNDCVADGPAIATTTTNSNGLYVFNNLLPGTYIVGVTPPTSTQGVYKSSPIDETNPNLDIDNNDNGTVQAGLEVRSCGVILAAGSEPTGETPNNGLAPDANSNLTVDFGFYLCPDKFTFPPIQVCAGETIDLTTLEPAGFTGGTWTTSLGAPLSSTIVGLGSYKYTYSNGVCTADGIQAVDLRIPDYAPTIAIAPGVINGIQQVRVIITISELLNQGSCTPIYVFVPRLEPRYSFTWNPTATQFGSGSSGAVQNAQWQYFTSNPNFYVWKYIGNPTFPASGTSKFGYVGTYNPNNTDGVTTFSVQIFQGSGGETNLTNNTDSEDLLYFRN